MGSAGQLETGRYIITNRKYRNAAILPDANDHSDIVAGVRENDAGEKVRYNSMRMNPQFTTLFSGTSTYSAMALTESRTSVMVHSPIARTVPGLLRVTLLLGEVALNNGRS
jgi:hypothetical protein